jgi:hypothetical protein
MSVEPSSRKGRATIHRLHYELVCHIVIRERLSGFSWQFVWRLCLWSRVHESAFIFLQLAVPKWRMLKVVRWDYEDAITRSPVHAWWSYHPWGAPPALSLYTQVINRKWLHEFSSNLLRKLCHTVVKYRIYQFSTIGNTNVTNAQKSWMGR